MNNKTITKFLILGVIIATISPAAKSHSNHGNDANVRAMASMLASMQHFPSEEDQVKLQEILDQDSSTDNEKTLASAIMRIEHQSNAEDALSLDSIIESETASGSIINIAIVIKNFSHGVSDADKRKLQLINFKG